MRAYWRNDARLLALGRASDVLALVPIGFVGTAIFVPDPLLDRFEVPVFFVLVSVLLSGHLARRAAKRAIADANAARESLARENRRQEAVRRLGERTLAGLSTPELLEAATTLVASELGMPYCGVFELDSQRGNLVLKAGVGWHEGCIGQATIGASAESAAAAHRNGGPTSSALGSDASLSYPPLLREHKIRSDISIPIGLNGHPYGVIAAYAEEVRPFADSDVRFLQLVSSLITSVLRRRRAEEGLHANEESLRLALELTHMGTWDSDIATDEAVWSKGLFDMTGIGTSTKPGYETFVSLLHPDDREHVTTAISAALAEGRDYELEDYRICRPDGEIRRIFSRGTWIKDSSGRPVRMLGVALDVTERRRGQEERAQLETQLRQAQKMEAIGQLAGGIAHDFNNLLLALRGYGEVALRSLARGEDVREEIEEMLAAAGRAGTLTRQLLAFSRRQILQPQIIDLRGVVDDMERLLARIIGEDLELATTTPDDSIFVHVDRGQLEQIVANLAVNARDAMPDGGRLTIELSPVDVGPHHSGGMPEGRYALLAVSDTGCGMDSETVAQIFEPFFTTKAGAGTGLGLATVHGIVKQSGGYIWVYSEPDRGTTFKIYLPAVGEGMGNEVTDKPQAADGGSETILLVEDDPQVRTIVSRMLTGHGYRTLAAGDGSDALAIAQTETIDLLLTDLVMRGLNGRETAELVRELHPDVAVLYMSGYTDDGVFRRGVLEHGTAFIQKPFGANDLLGKLRDVLDGQPIRRSAIST